MERVFLSWNWENWITVVLMAALGFALAGIVSQLLKNIRAGGQ
jgi:preprotein translocase subunit Sss1